MKRILPLVFMVIILAGCNLPSKAAPTPSDADMATRVAQILTSMPSPTSQGTLLQPTSALPTARPTDVIVQVESPTPEPTTAPTATFTTTPTSTSAPAATPTLSPSDPAARLGAAAWTDNMDNGDNWPLGTDKYTALEFKDGSMRLTGLTGTDGWRLTWPKLTDFYLEASFLAPSCTGSDRYGLIVRVPNGLTPDRGYLVSFTCDGKYSLRRWNASVGTKGEMVTLIDWKESTAIKAGANQTNKMGIMAVGSRLIVYANGQLLGEAKDATFDKGYFGVFVGARQTEDLTIRVDQIRYWENPTP